MKRAPLRDEKETWCCEMRAIAALGKREKDVYRRTSASHRSPLNYTEANE